MNQPRRRRSVVEIRKMTTLSWLMLCYLAVNNLAMSNGNWTTTATPVTRERESDSLLIARCRSSCNHQYGNKTCQQDCTKDFLDNPENGKPGDCPRPSPADDKQTCGQVCEGSDFDCVDTDKCCITSCGRVCHQPFGLEKIRHLPPIPRNLKLTRTDRIPHRQSIIEWELPDDLNYYGQIFSVLQSRSHVGTEFAEAKMNKFHPHVVLNYYEERTAGRRISAGVVKLNPGRWYQFRVAAVNVYGTRGFSEYTPPFQLSKKPTPPKPPRNVTLNPFQLGINNTLTQKVFWSLPKSDIPIKKYRISWSLYIKDVNESLLKETAVVLEPKRHFEIRDLLPNSMYYLQIQAISLYGIRRLKSEPATQLINTTLPVGAMEELQGKRVINTVHNLTMGASKKSITGPDRGVGHREFVTIVPTENDDFKIKFVANKKFGLVVRTDFRLTGNDRVRVEICNGTEACLNKKGQNKPQFVIAKKARHDFVGLRFNRRYTIGFKMLRTKLDNKSDFDYIRTFVTPTCQSYRKSYKKLDIKCNQPTKSQVNGSTNRVRRKIEKKDK